MNAVYDKQKKNVLPVAYDFCILNNRSPSQFMMTLFESNVLCKQIFGTHTMYNRTRYCFLNVLKMHYPKYSMFQEEE